MNEFWEQAPCGLLAFKEDGRIVRANERVRALLEYSAVELAELKFDAALSMSSRIFHQTHFHPMLRLHGRADEIYLTLRSKSGRSLPVLANAVRQMEEAEWVITCAMISVHRREQYEQELVNARNRAEEALRNNEALRRAKEELEARMKELDRNLSEVSRRRAELLRLNEILSHDLREPVRKLRVFADLLQAQEKERLSPDGSVAVKSICSSSDRIHNLLRALQSYLAVDGASEEPQPARLGELLQAGLARAQAQGCEVEAVAGDLPEVTGFPRQLAALFEALCRNAWMRRGEDRLVLSVRGAIVQLNSYRAVKGHYEYADHARLTLTDNSRGFQGLNPAELFELLRKPGLDMGPQTDLAICKKIVENHHGSIALTSDTPWGATFTIVLPLKPDLRH